MARESLYSLKKKLKEQKDELKKVEDDRDKYRNFIKHEISNHLNCMKKDTYYPAEAMVKKYVNFTSSVDNFYLYLN